MEFPLALLVIFLCLAVTLLAQAAITIYTYNKEKRTQDLNYYWSVLVLIGAIIGTIAALGGIVMKSTGVAAPGGGGAATGGVPSSATLGAQLEAAQNLEQAQAEAAKVFGAK